MKCISLVVVTVFALSCSSEDLDDAVFAVDADQSGVMATHHDCTAPHAEVHHQPDHHGSDHH